MRADWRARLDAELEASQGYKANSADWLDGRWADIKAARDYDDPRRGRTGVADRDAQGDRRQDHRRAPRASTSTAPSSASSTTRAQGDRDRRGHRLGDRRGARLLLAAARRPSGAALRPGHRARHLLAAPLGAGRPGERGPLHPVQPRARGPGPLRGHQLDAVGRGGARLRVRLLAGRARTRSRCGRRSSATSPTARRWCSTSSSRRASASGCACRAWSACCRTATRGRGRSIPRRGSSASCRCAPRTTCRSPTAPRRPTTSTSCAGS